MLCVWEWGRGGMDKSCSPSLILSSIQYSNIINLYWTESIPNNDKKKRKSFCFQCGHPHMAEPLPFCPQLPAFG